MPMEERVAPKNIMVSEGKSKEDKKKKKITDKTQKWMSFFIHVGIRRFDVTSPD